MKKNDNVIRIDGIVEEAFPNAVFRVQLEGGHIILGHVSGKMRVHYIRIVPGDRVLVELPADDLSRGRIIHRYR